MTDLDLGLELTIEPNVVPRGTVDLKSLDAGAGTPPPAVRVQPNGRVVRAEAPSGLENLPTGIVTPATPAVASPSVNANQEALAAAPEPPKPAPEPAPANVAVSASEPAAPLGARLRKRASSGAMPVHADSAIPPRPASASETGSTPRTGSFPPDDDYETAQISGGFASALGALVKVTLVLVGVTILVALPLLFWWNDLWPTQQVAVAPAEPTTPRKHDVAAPVSATETSKPELKVETAKGDVAPVPTAEKQVAAISSGVSGSASQVALGQVEPKADSKDAAAVGSDKDKIAPAVAKSDEEPRVDSAQMGADSDIDMRKVEALRAEAVRLYHEGKFDESIAKLDELLALSPKDSDALFRKGLALHRKGDLKGAALVYEATTMAAPRDPRAWNNLGLVREALGDPSGARVAWEKGFAYDPTYPNILVNLGRLERDTNPQSALARFDKALERDARNPYARYQRAAVLGLSLNRADEGRRELLDLAGQDSPMRAEALDTLGMLSMRQRKPQEAVEFYKRALAAEPRQEETHLRLAVALYTAGQNDQAEGELRAYLERHPKSADAWKTLGAVLVRLDRLPEAKVAYEKALAINDKDVTTLYNYALCAERFGNFLFAIQEYERVVQIDPNHWKSLENLGRLYRRAGRDQKALEYFDRALKIQPNEADLHLHRANALTALRRDPEARDELQAFIRLAPTGDKRIPDAQRALASTTELSPGDQPQDSKGF